MDIGNGGGGATYWALAAVLIGGCGGCRESPNGSEPRAQADPRRSATALGESPQAVAPSVVSAPADATDGARHGAPAGAAQAPPAGGLTAVEKERVEQAFRAWLSAQNQGDFAAYSRLYSERFTGIRRSGPRLFRSAREGWLADRKPAFARPLTVTAEEVEISGTSGFARVRFVQGFATPSYRDRGAKELQWAQSKEGYRIVREEMLRSDLKPKANTGDALSPSLFSFARDTSAGVVILLQQRSQLGTGAPELIGHAEVQRALREDVKLGEEQQWLGQAFRIWPSAEPGCEVTPRRLIAYAEAIPHFSQDQRWQGAFDEPPVPEAQQAMETLDLAQPLEWLALLAPGQHCEEAQFARLASHEPPLFYEREQLPAAELQRVQKAFDQLEQTQKLRQAQKQESGVAAEWSQDWIAFRGPSGDRWWAQAAQLGDGYCSDFGGSFSALFRLQVQGPTLVSDPRYSIVDGGPTEPMLPQLALDVDRNGTPELLFRNVLLGGSGERYEPVRVARVPDFDCHC